MTGKLHLGTCSWKYPSWEGLVYKEAHPTNFLEQYAQKYSSVEIDQWFWSLFGPDKVVLPKQSVVEEYAHSVPEDFRFTIKAPNSLSLSHIYKQYTGGKLVENPHFLSPELYEQFLYSIDQMQAKVGAISLQFEYLNKAKMPSATIFLERFTHFISSIDTKIPLCIEIRNPNFLTKNYFEILKQNQVGHTFCQGYYMPDIREVYQKYTPELQETSIIRLLGANRQDIEKTTEKRWNKIVEPKNEEIVGIAKLIRKMVDQAGMDVYLNVNNHYEGSAPITIERMLKYL